MCGARSERSRERAAISRDSSLGNNGSRTGSASSASNTVSRDGCCFPPAGRGQPRSRAQGRQSKKKKKNNNMETSQLQECFCCLHFRNQSELLSVSRNAKEKATSAAALFQFLPTDCGESLKTPPAKLLLYFSSLFKRLLSSSATITRITGTGGEHCSVGVQFAVSTRLARFITN